MTTDGLPLTGRLQNVLDDLGDREPSTTQESQAITESIRIAKGYLDDELLSDLENLTHRNRGVIHRLAAKSRETEAAYTRSMSEQLYSSKYRLFYELIQNADDSKYTNAVKANVRRFVRFKVTPGIMTVETNEDGFIRANVESICATGKSSKKASTSDSHIGEKGFGFKSVFAIAHDVKIQSGIWSFRFQHRQNDDGLGMVTPLDAPPQRLPDDATTRITLQLTDTTPRGFERLVKAMLNVPETTILFLQHLDEIHTHITNVDGGTENISITKTGGNKMNMTQVMRSRESAGSTVSSVSAYLKFSDILKDMPQDSHRANKTTARIDLLFPVDPRTQKPKLSPRGQHVFAYLPLQRVAQIPFLIQSDFITAANRESITDCPWNQAICSGVARVFSLIIGQRFAKADHPLRYSWLDFMPTEPMEDHWESLYKNIKNYIRDMPILQTWERRGFKKPSEVKKLAPIAIHNKQPILNDLEADCYLAPEYDSKHGTILSELGASMMTWTAYVDRLQADLVSPQSRVKTTPSCDSWHDAFARSIELALRKSSPRDQDRIKKQAIIPLTGGSRWTGAPGIPGGIPEVYFPTTESIPIPNTVGLKLVEHTAALSSARQDLYTALGVRHCSKKNVIDKIRQVHQSTTSGPSHDISQLQYLFHFHSDPDEIKPWIWIPVVGGTSVKASLTDLYLPSKDEHDLHQLLPKHIRYNIKEVAQFLSTSLVDVGPSSVRAQGRDWKTWITQITDAQSRPFFKESRGDPPTYFMASDMRAVLQHNPDKFLSTLRKHWISWQGSASQISSDLRCAMVPCKSGNMSPLSLTYLPSPSIMLEINAIRLHDADFPLVKLPDVLLDEITTSQWKFLEQFGVEHQPSLRFYKEALATLKSTSRMTDENSPAYAYVSMASLATFQDNEDLRSFFGSRQAVWDPQGLRWVGPSRCIWQGPEFMSYKTVLSRSYGHNPLLENFFKITLGVQECDIEHILAELDARRGATQKTTTVSITRNIYAYLFENARSEGDWTKISNAFSTTKLVLGEDDHWYTGRTCLWKSAFPVSGFQDLSKLYPDLEDFFVKRLRVKKATPSMLINEVRKMASGLRPNISGIHTRLVDIGMMLAKNTFDANIARTLESLKEVAFLPQRSSDGTLTLLKVTAPFAIPDHQRYYDALNGKDVLLEFTMTEVQILHNLFLHIGITDRYLSKLVKEVSTAGSDATKNEALSTQLQLKAYALFWALFARIGEIDDPLKLEIEITRHSCAAKYKSVEALRGDRVLFDQLKTCTIYTTSDITTNIVLPLSTGAVSVVSNRIFVHHETIDGILRLYVPEQPQQRRACYRSQLPKLLTFILGVGDSATWTISNILESDLGELDDVLDERDVPPVDWITKPTFVLPDVLPDGVRENLAPIFETSRISPIVGDELLPPEPRTSEPHIAVGRRVPSGVDIGNPGELRTPSQYSRLIEQIVQSAQRSNFGRQESILGPVFDHTATFGTRDGNEFAHDRRIGAAGEAYVFEVLSNLRLPNFTEANWQSTIRGELACVTRYSTLLNWTGRETADIVYTDSTGALTQYLRDNCTGRFPDQITTDRDHTTMPIRYYLEVKSTTSVCNTRFYMSSGQYKRMHDIQAQMRPRPKKVYVIFRIYNLTTTNVGMKIFVNPPALEGTCLDFEAQQWIGKTF